MAYQLHRLGDTLDYQVQRRFERLLTCDRPRLRRLWAYYRNPMLPRALATGDSDADRPYRQAQEWGLPPRITGTRSGPDLGSVPDSTLTRKEVVIENDIAWRIDTQVDYLFGKNLVIASAAPDPQRRQVIGELLRLILAHNGGIVFLQQLALLGAVHGFVDVLVKFCPEPTDPAPQAVTGAQDLGPTPILTEPTTGARPAPEVSPSGEPAPPVPTAPAGDHPSPGPDISRIPGASTRSLEMPFERLARMIRLEIVEPARALPVLSPDDWRIVQAYAQVYEVDRPAAGPQSPAARRARWWERWMSLGNGSSRATSDRVQILDLITPTRWQRYQDQTLISEGDNSLGRIPLVHIQNAPLPFEYAGVSDVEALIPLQDELNTRLSDRANRITLQSFKMYLGIGIDDFTAQSVAPGRMWSSANEQAKVQEFGGDADAPSELAHLQDIREAMDKQSCVTPVAAGAIKDRIGRLTSAAALRVTLLALLAKTDRKRTSYGQGLEQLCELSLAWLDRAGLFPTTSDERRIELHWPSPLPENDTEKLQEARMKSDLGVPKEVVLRELGY